jgi:Zn finger protein HypA/HybF involved in hydrogenase expression
MKIIVKEEKLKCERCGHIWKQRIKDVRICPSCKSLRWDKPKKEKR